MANVLLVGPPRSGTTWIGQTLGRARGATYVHEPDGDHQVFALRAKRGGPRHVALRPGDPAPRYEALWRGAFAGGAPNRAPLARVAKYCFETSSAEEHAAARWGAAPTWRMRLATAWAAPLVAPGGAPVDHVVAKSVQASLAVEWIATRFAPTVVVVERHPLNALASWLDLGMGGNGPDALALWDFAQRTWGVTPPDPDDPKVVRRAFNYGVLAAALRGACRDHPDWHVVRHDDLCVDPTARFRALFDTLGLVWTDAVEQFLQGSDRDGSGYRTQRQTATLPDQWRSRLAADDVETIVATLARFPYDLAAFAR